MEDEIVKPDSSIPPPPKPRRGRKPGQPPAAHHVPVPADSLKPIHDVAAMTGQKPGDLLAGFRSFLAQAAAGLAVEFASKVLTDFKARLEAKEAELGSAAGAAGSPAGGEA